MGQPACLEEDLLSDPIKSCTMMTLQGSRPCYSPCRNLLPIDFIEDKLTRDLGLVGGSNSGSTSPARSCNSTLGPILVFVLILALVPAPVSIDELFKKFMKAYLELNQGPRQPPTERKWILKAKVSEVYYSKSYIDCYHFCQQWKDYFETARATGAN